MDVVRNEWRQRPSCRPAARAASRYDTLNAVSKAIEQHLAKTIPARFVAKSGPADRVGKLFVDYVPPGHGVTTDAACSARSRLLLGVSMPAAWEFLSKLRSGLHCTVSSARASLVFKAIDPWQDYWEAMQSVIRSMKTLNFKLSGDASR